MVLKLSQAIKKRENLLKTAEGMQRWYEEQRSVLPSALNHFPLRKAIENVIEEAFVEYQKYDDLIEKTIEGQEIQT